MNTVVASVPLGDVVANGVVITHNLVWVAVSPSG
jgi:hypothetical protein